MRNLVGAIMITLLSACSVVSSSSTATPAPNTTTPVPATPTPIVMASPTPQPSLIADCPSAPIIRLIVQNRGLVSVDDPEPLNLRRDPGIDAEKITGIQPGRSFFVLGGPVCADGYSWFRVRYRDLIGWIAEGDPELYYVEPVLTG